MVMAVVRFLLAVSSCLISRVISFTCWSKVDNQITKEKRRNTHHSLTLSCLVLDLTDLTIYAKIKKESPLRKPRLPPEKLNDRSLRLLQGTCGVSTNSCLCPHHLSHFVLDRGHLLIFLSRSSSSDIENWS